MSSQYVPSEASNIYNSLQRRIHDLNTYQIPRLQQCSGPISLQQSLASELRDDMDTLRKSVKTLEMMATDQDTIKDREALAAIVKQFEQQTASIKQAYRAALLSSNANIKKQASSDRYELLPPNATASTSTLATNKPETDRISSGGDDALQTKTNEVTDALRRTTKLMQAELERSVMATQMFEESSATLRSTSTLYSRYTSLLDTSSHLVRQIERADWYDRMIIFIALGLFFLVILWIVRKRVLNKVAGGVGWWLGGSFKLLNLALGRAKPASKDIVKGLQHEAQRFAQTTGLQAASEMGVAEATISAVAAVVGTATTTPFLPSPPESMPTTEYTVDYELPDPTSYLDAKTARDEL